MPTNHGNARLVSTHACGCALFWKIGKCLENVRTGCWAHRHVWHVLNLPHFCVFLITEVLAPGVASSVCTQPNCTTPKWQWNDCFGFLPRPCSRSGLYRFCLHAQLWSVYMCGSKCHSITEWYSVPSTMHSKSKNVFNTAWVHLRPCTSMMLQLLFELGLATLLWSICLQSIHVFRYTKHPESVGIPAQWMGNFFC